MRKKHFLFRTFFPFALIWLGLVSACSGQEISITPAVQGVSIARRGVSLAPTKTEFAAEAPVTPSETAELPTSIEISGTPTETPTVPGAGPSRTPESTSTNAATGIPPTAAFTATSEPVVCQGEVNRALESEVINLINQERSRVGLTPLAEQSQLTQTARSHAEDMACNDFFDHLSPTEGGVIDRVTAQGYDFTEVGEIIAGGFVDSESVVAGWMSSPDHAKNILSKEFTQIGVGFAEWEDSTYGMYWVVVFGKP